MAEDKSAVRGDARAVWLCERVQRAFAHIPAPKFNKAWNDPDNLAKLDEFIHTDARVLCYYGDGVSPSLGIPRKLPRGVSKCMYVLKMRPGPMPADALGRDLLVSDLTSDPLDSLERILSEVYVPLLSNPANQEGWGEVAAKEMLDRVHAFLASVSITVGATRGETCLPLPPLDASTASHISAKDRIHLLEGAVITWTRQIKAVLKLDPESLLKAGQHPTPDVEVEFWKTKAANLNAIFEQLQSERIRRVLQFLDLSRSTYCSPFAKLCKEVFAARLEANDNVKYLRTLEQWFAKLNGGDDFEKMPELFRPVMHILLLIWKNSKFYNTPARLVVIIREICNAIINQALKYVSGKQIFDLIAEEQAPAAVTKLRTTLRVCGEFKRVYFNYKATANAECPSNPWRIQNTALFLRLDAFLERCHDVLEMTQIIVQFSKLERIVIGGSKGKVLTATLEHIFGDFKSAVAAFEGVPYDIMEVERKEFDDDFYAFRNRIKELERRLGAVLTQAFDDSVNIYARFKLLDSFDTLLERPLIQDELERKHITLVQMYGADLKRVQEIFLTERDAPPIAWNLPPIAGALYWCRGLKERIVEPMAKIRQLNKDIMNREEAKEVMKVYTTVMSSLDDFEHQKVEEWGADVERSSQAKLKLPLLTRSKDGDGDVDAQLLQVNFDPGLVRLLREVKYFLLLGLDVPASALEIYKKAETFRRQTGNLDLIVNMYNQMMLEMLPVEAPLLKAQLVRIDATLARGIKDLNWKSAAIDAFISEAHGSVKAAHEMLFLLKGNLKDVVVEMEGWSREPLLQRKSKPMTPEEFEAMYKAARTARYAAIQDGGKAIDRKLKDSQGAMKVVKGSPHWAAYVDFVNGIVVQGLARLVVVSLRRLVDMLSAEKIRKNQDLPMLIIDLNLVSKGVRFTPEVTEDAAGGLYDTVNGWVDSFYHSATMFKRLDDNDGRYVKEMVDDMEVQMLLASLHEALARSESSCVEFRAKYETYAYLWNTDMHETFKAFCDAAYVELQKTEEQIKAEADMDEDEIPPQPRIPDLAKFDAEITRYRELGEQIAGMKATTDLGWLRINSQPIKNALATVVSQWTHLFMHHLQTFVLTAVTDMHEFIVGVTTGLEETVPADGSAGAQAALKRCMTHIRDVRKTRYIRKAIISPLRRAVTLLKKHGLNVDDTRIAGLGATVSEYLEQGDLKVEHCINKTFAKKEVIFPLQTAEMEKIKVQATAFEDRVREFWNGFRKNAPFAFTGPVDTAYGSLDTFYATLVKLEAEARELNEIEELFELPISKFNEMAQCRQQLRLLKTLWDFRGLVQATYDAWKTELWAEIDTDRLEEANKKMATELRKLGDGNQIIKGWQVFKDIEAVVRDMATTLPLVNALHSPSMRPRHWKELARVCGVRSLDPSDPKFSLEDIIELRLHLHAGEVEEIVDTANKEQKIERKMDEIEGVWRTSVLDFVPHKDSEVRIVKASDEVMENLDAHQMELQGIVSMGKVMEFFRERVEASQKSLGIVEEVLKEWLGVTKAWASLESIFLGSADIRAQLPDDTKRFEGIDSTFKDLMKSAVETPNVVEACTKDGRGEVLREMSRNLELCQKSLNDYLDMKRKIFPRFYFCSTVALLDILSNGNNPKRVCNYLSDLYDSIADLTFEAPAEEGGVSNVATRMIAKDGEIVDFFEPFVITGAVERWLNELTEMQQTSLRYVLEAAIETAVNWEVERPRHVWLEDYPAQVVLVGTQIYWTEETQAALDELEGGQEDAVKKYLSVCNERLSALIQRVLLDLTPDLRTKIISLITMDVHSRDVVQRLIDQKADGPSSFIWSQQLRFYWQAETRDVAINITDFKSKYFYEWVGNSGRLVITPLTDRCYITLTLALRLFLGGAPAGPAGTGKTETTKDLARALALPCYVFNCVADFDGEGYGELLTEEGFLTLSEVEARRADPSKPPLKFAGYNPSTDELVYEEPEAYIINEAATRDMIALEQTRESERWGPHSDPYGRTSAAVDGMERQQEAGVRNPDYDVSTRAAPSSYVSALLTPDHDVYARFGHYVKRTTATGTPTLNVNWGEDEVMPRTAPQKFVERPYKKVHAASLLSDKSEQAVGLLAAAGAGRAVTPDDVAIVETALAPLLLPAGKEELFLEVYGYWLGDDSARTRAPGDVTAVLFSPRERHDTEWLDVSLRALGVSFSYDPMHVVGADGKQYTTHKFAVTAPAWLALFGNEYGETFKQKLAAAAADAEGAVAMPSTVEPVRSGKCFMPWVWHLPASGARAVVRGYHRADGSFKQNHLKICTSSIVVRDELVRLLFHAGYSPCFYLMAEEDSFVDIERHGDHPVTSRARAWAVVWGADREGCEPTLSRAREVRKVTYTGRTWCVRMPSGFIVTRRSARDNNGVVTKTTRPLVMGNCSDQMTYQSLANVFSGLSQSGAWGCFDEFNRINIEVLSVVATQVKAILDACVLYSNPANRPPEFQGAPAGSPPVVVGYFELGGETLSLVPSCGLFITMNPGYAGRTELPENLKALFRPCAMVKPDLPLICENMLMSEGFQNARPLSVKFVTLYELASELLSPQAHYDWGLRAVKSVLRVAGTLKRQDPDIDEEGILMRALRDFNTPKMPTSDLPIFLRLIQDLFPRYYTLPTKLRAELARSATQACKECRPPLQHDHGFVAKVVQLQDLMDVRHSVMLVGPAGCGKTTIWKTLAAAHNLGKPKNKAPCIYEIVDPKAVTSNELYGYMTLAKEWKDGVLSIIMRGMSKNFKELGYGPHQTSKWVVLDGDIDAVWVESCLSEDSQVLTSSGFMFVDEAIEAWDEGRNPKFFVAGYDPDSQSIVYERPRRMIVNASADQEMIDFTPAHEQHRWGVDSDLFGRSPTAVASHAGMLARGACEASMDTTGGSDMLYDDWDVEEDDGIDELCDGSGPTSAASNHVSLLVTGDHDMYCATGRSVRGTTERLFAKLKASAAAESSIIRFRANAQNGVTKFPEGLGVSSVTSGESASEQFVPPADAGLAETAARHRYTGMETARKVLHELQSCETVHVRCNEYVGGRAHDVICADRDCAWGFPCTRSDGGGDQRTASEQLLFKKISKKMSAHLQRSSPQPSPSCSDRDGAAAETPRKHSRLELSYTAFEWAQQLSEARSIVVPCAEFVDAAVGRLGSTISTCAAADCTFAASFSLEVGDARTVKQLADMIAHCMKRHRTSAQKGATFAASADAADAAVEIAAAAPGGFSIVKHLQTTLGLSPEQVPAFLELYGFWLGDGSMVDGETVIFQQVKDCDKIFLDDCLRTLNVRFNAYDRTSDSPVSHKPMTVKTWIVKDDRFNRFFADEYGHKYKNHVDFEGRGVRAVSGVLTPAAAIHPSERARLSDSTDPDESSVVLGAQDGQLAARARTSSAYDSRLSAESIASAKWMAWWVWLLGKEHANRVLIGLWRADGQWKYARDNAKARRRAFIYTSSARFRDEILRLCLHAGRSATFILMSPPGAVMAAGVTCKAHAWRVSFSACNDVASSRATQPTLDTTAGDVRKVKYTGRTWCFSMPSGFLIARRAHVDREGVVTKASRAIVVGNCNTVMDDNKVLTLVSNERIPLSSAMRMVFEVNSLANASPATVSRAGILYINDTDIGWRPYVETWMATLHDEVLKAHLPGLFDKYIETVYEGMRRTMKTAVPLPLINQVMSVCRLLEGYIEMMPKEPRKPAVEILENFFYTAVMWAFGGALVVEVGDGGTRGNHRQAFHGMLATVAPNIKFPKEPEDALCFDFFFNPETEEMEHWSSRVAKYTPVPIGSGVGETPFSALVVPTVDSTRLSAIMGQLVHRGHPVMFVGSAGTGKTTLVKTYLSTLDENSLTTLVTMNYYMDSAALQQRVDGAVDKRSGRLFGPPTGKRRIFYVDDLNLPFCETYGTQTSLSLLRQIMDHRSYFDRTDLGFRKEVTDCFFIASMNPTAGSFTVTERLQRLFTTFACLMPSDSDLNMIFRSLLVGHFASFSQDVQRLVEPMVDAGIRLHKAISAEFLPDAERFMYNWNMRELANVFQGVCQARPEFYPQPLKVLRLWVHEAHRVFGDRLVDSEDATKFDTKLRAVAKLVFKDTDQDALFAGPIIFTNFAAQVGGEPMYLPLPTGDAGLAALSKTLQDKLEDYNASHSIMDLVLFEQAMEHVCRITRIISNPAGNAMLIGVGGSGKQSLSRLAAHICGYDVRQLAITARFSVADLKDSLKELYRAAGKGQGIVFLLTDSQIINDKFLVYVNDILSSGWISDLFEREDLDAIFSSLRNEAKAQGVLVDVPDEMLRFFISRVRANMHLILCFSPVGASFRVRARRFPGLINCTIIDRFHAWPKDALISVAKRFIEDLDLSSDTIKDAVALHMAEVHTTVTSVSDDFREKMRRYNYVTPKSFLELIAFYRHLLEVKRQASGKNIKRLEDGLAKLRKTADDVAELRIDVQRAMARAENEVRNTEVLVAQMSKQRAEAEVEKEAASKVADRASAASAAASAVESQADKELSEAKPALERAQEAVKGLDKASLTELKNFNKPPKGVEKVTAACLMMIEGEFKNHEKWDRAKKMMSDVGAFLASLERYDARNMTEDLVARLEPYVHSEGFNETEMRSKSAAAANLCAFVVNLFTFNRIYVKVKPLMEALERAQGDRAEAQSQLDAANERVARIEENLRLLQEQLEAAEAKKQAAESEAARCSERLALAGRLVNGLASENERWGTEVGKLQQSEMMLIGDVLLASAFVSYIGAFNNVFRRRLWADTWMPDLIARGIPLSEGTDPLSMLTDEGRIALMMNEGLPADRVSIENGAIITNCKRWPLIIDPQLQGIKWLRKREAANRLTVVQLTQPNWLKSIVNAVQQGLPAIIENVGEDIDATLEPVLARAVYQRARTMYLRLGGEEVEFDPRFRLYLQTKLPNPHYRPEIQAQCTIVNFIATESGLQDQLLARVVNEEKSELERRKQELQDAFNTYKVQLLQLEDDLLNRLANAPDDILSDVALIEGLEATKKASVEINAAVLRGKETEVEINLARQVYVPVAEEGAMLYFMISQLNGIEHMYQYSLDSFMLYFYKAIREATRSDDTITRVGYLRETLRVVVYTWVSRGLFERHKLILLAQLTFQLVARGKLRDVEDFAFAAFQFLLRGPRKDGEALPAALDWLPDAAWKSLLALADLDGGEFAKLPADLSEAPTRFKEWFTHVTPESEKLPLDWSALDKTPFKKLLVLRCMRPDRLNVALRDFVGNTLPQGSKFVDCDATLNSAGILEDTLRDSTPATPIYFILSPGSDVVSDVDRLAQKHGYVKGASYHNVSMGQGQDIVAMEKLDMGHKQGHWVLLNNVHLMPRWLIELEKRLDHFASEGSHERFRVFLTSEPSPHIPIGVLNRSIKLTNEPPQGLKANLKRAFCSFTPEYINEMDTKMRAIVFGICHFHAVLIERKKFGSMGYNMMYPFSGGDLRDASVVVQNYMENATGGKIPWDDLRYAVGSILYGGHVVNAWDAKLVTVYLEHFLRDELLDEMELFPYNKDEKGASFKSPSPTTYDRYLEHIETEFKGDTPIAFGLHPNAELGFRTEQSETLLRTLLELQPRDAASASSEDRTPRAIAAAAMQEFVDTFGETSWDVEEIQGGMEEVGPFQNVLILELKQMNNLLAFIKRSLATLKLGFDGKVTQNEDMERLETELALDKVPLSWGKLAWPSLRALASWKSNLAQRVQQLNDWVSNPMEVPKVVWLSGLINPQSFLTAIRQQTAQRTGQELDKLLIHTEVTKRTLAEVDAASRDGCYVHGLYVVGARFDIANSVVDKSRPRELHCEMPVINCRSIPSDKLEEKGIFFCPVYKTLARGPTYVCTAQLKSKSPPARWIMAGACLVMDVAAR